ncbi:MAG: nucleoside triphosphate pyrophosphohydrolase [Pseudanabaena sp. ELA607]
MAALSSGLSDAVSGVIASEPNPARTAALTAMASLIEVVAQLRDPQGGCPWDLAQTPQSLAPYVIEEAYEVVDALQREDTPDIAEELGDLLLQVVLQAQIAQESGQFNLADVVQGITTKLIRRHPHVFGDHEASTVEAVQQNWAQIKEAEKAAKHNSSSAPALPPISTKLERYARTLPPLAAALKISVKAAAHGFEWENIDGVWEKFHEELEELHQAIAQESKAAQEGELGDLLFSLIQVARWHDLDPMRALQTTNRKFVERFSMVESLSPEPIENLSIDQLEALWRRVKEILRQKQEKQGE